MSWRGLVLDGFSYAVKKGKMSPEQASKWQPQLDSSDLDEILGAAEFMSRKLGAPDSDLYARWLEDVFKSVQPANKGIENAICALHAAGVPLCTLNYDPLLELVTGLPRVILTETIRVTAWMRKETPCIVHLHGSWDAPASCILGIRDYQTTLDNDVRDLIQRSLGSFRRLLFIGCGDTFADPNFSALIKWLRVNLKVAAPEHLALVTDGEVAARHADPAWQGFVEPLGYGAGHEDLSGFLLRLFPARVTRATKRSLTTKAPASISKHARLLLDYRTFLLKDCGQMTIEGVRADMDTAQRRFDLERLFVPLEVLPCPPEIPDSDALREQKLHTWQERHKDAIPFGKMFARHKQIALLALPGGGKSLLLKRLAVAYADPVRREATKDALPDLNLLPVLIRCREWRDLIHRPISTILKSLPDITGNASLNGLSDALTPLFRKGRILLLVDGLDEIHDDALRTTFVEHLEQFLADNKLTRLVVTSREAGFSLVAPSLARFCDRWRVAPLRPEAIGALCDHWHLLMTGDSPEAQAEGRRVAKLLMNNESLRRLAENPLLLTMLLVVKHGAGRLPPDRVSLYGRAVEVLLDTWNIKGHEPLNLKEAVPQLAFVAFQLLRAGKQTATERELLTLFEEAREKVPQIRRYAKDNPQDFLKRVELRSSLLVEVGRQAEGVGTVPFYQFRHLTFQEYLAAVAVAEGHYIEYGQADTVLTPLQSYLTAEEWKEVVPMSAVLARKQAEPLIGALVERGSRLREQAEGGGEFDGRENWINSAKVPAPVARLVQCLAEEAEAAPATVAAALQLVAFFARGCQPGEDWPALSRGPYGAELLHQAWLLYAAMQWPAITLLRASCAVLAALRRPDNHWQSSAGRAELGELLGSQNAEDIWRGLMTCSGLLGGRPPVRALPSPDLLPLADVERQIFQDDRALQDAAMWTWGYIHHAKRSAAAQPSQAVLDALLLAWLGSTATDPRRVAASAALSTQLGLPRSAWTPVLTEAQAEQVRRAMERKGGDSESDVTAGRVVAFHGRNVMPEEELAGSLAAMRRSAFRRGAVDAMLAQMGETGQKHIKTTSKA
jgi:hypothetical protein